MEIKGLPDDNDVLMTPREVASMFRVQPKTVTRWAQSGKLPSIRTPGNHRRYRVPDVRKFFEENYEKISERSEYLDGLDITTDTLE